MKRVIYYVYINSEALHVAHLMASHGYFFPIDDHCLTVKNDNTFYRFQTPYFWPSNCWEPENTDYGTKILILSLVSFDLSFVFAAANDLTSNGNIFNKYKNYLFIVCKSNSRRNVVLSFYYRFMKFYIRVYFRKCIMIRPLVRTTLNVTAVYLCKRTMQNKTRLELADYEAENLARLQKMFSRKWEFIFMQAEAQSKVDKKRDKLERKVLDSQERAFWDVHRPMVILPTFD